MQEQQKDHAAVWEFLMVETTATKVTAAGSHFTLAKMGLDDDLEAFIFPHSSPLP